MSRKNSGQSEADARVLILYALSKFGAQVAREAFAPVLLSYDGSDGSWIDLQLRLDSIIEDGLARETDGCLSITSDGLEVLHVYEDAIPEEAREAVDTYFREHREELYDRLHVSASFTPHEGGFLVRLGLKEGHQPIFTLELDTITREQAMLVCENFKKDPAKIYAGMIRLVTGEADS